MKTEGLDDAKIGDPLVLVTGDRRDANKEVTVSRIGRKWMYVSRDGRELRERFDRCTGKEDTQFGYAARLLTPEMYAERQERGSLFAELMAAGIEIRRDMRADVPTVKLRALRDIIQGE